MRLDYAHVVVLDDFFGEAERVALMEHLTAPGWDHTQVRIPRRNQSHCWQESWAAGIGCIRALKGRP